MQGDFLDACRTSGYGFWQMIRLRPPALAVAAALAMAISACGAQTVHRELSASTGGGQSTTAVASPTPLSPAPSAAAPSAGASSHAGGSVASTHPSATTPIKPVSGTALAELASLPVKGRAPKTGYSRAQFGPAWTDATNSPGGHNGCDTRNDILARDLISVTYRSGHCVVASGVLHDPYTGKTIRFVRGVATSTAIQIDHVVALSNAWQTGAQQLTAQQRIDYANDPAVLLAVDGPINEQKGDGDAATWLPPNTSYRCSYVARQVAIKKKYRLWVTPPERDAIARVLATCPSQTAPVVGATIAAHPTSAPPVSTPRPPAPPVQGGAVYYANCAAVRAAGKAPLYRGQPGYRAALDRDNDGVACE
ncbi:Protein of unknown function [Frankineae bacterium MT45]|nr:Protein of unknown function [Frankineae bacterium MT45]